MSLDIWELVIETSHATDCPHRQDPTKLLELAARGSCDHCQGIVQTEAKQIG
jgi:hypothetical protein